MKMTALRRVENPILRHIWHSHRVFAIAYGGPSSI